MQIPLPLRVQFTASCSSKLADLQLNTLIHLGNPVPLESFQSCGEGDEILLMKFLAVFFKSIDHAPLCTQNKLSQMQYSTLDLLLNTPTVWGTNIGTAWNAGYSPNLQFDDVFPWNLGGMDHLIKTHFPSQNKQYLVLHQLYKFQLVILLHFLELPLIWGPWVTCVPRVAGLGGGVHTNRVLWLGTLTGWWLG